MPKTHPPYPAEYRRGMVEQARAGRSLKELAREFEPSVESIRQWVRQAQLDMGERSDGLTSSEREELTRLRRENRVLREEREILSKAAAWFAGAVRNFVFEPVVDERSSRVKRRLNYLQSRSGGRSQGRREPARAAREPLTAHRRGGYRQSHHDASLHSPPERSGPRTGSPAGSWQRATKSADFSSAPERCAAPAR